LIELSVGFCMRPAAVPAAACACATSFIDCALHAAKVLDDEPLGRTMLPPPIAPNPAANPPAIMCACCAARVGELERLLLRETGVEDEPR